MTMVQSSAGSISRAPRPSSLADVLDLILDKGLVIDAYVRVSLAGIELLTVDARVVVASVDTYLRFAEAVNRLDLTSTEQPGLKALTGSSSDDENSSNNSSGGRAQSKNAVDEDGGHEDAEDDADDSQGGLLERITERARFDR